MSSKADYWHFQTWRKNEDVTIVLSGLMEQTEYSYIYCFAEDDESDGMDPSFFRTVQHIISQTHNTGLQINSTAGSSMCLQIDTAGSSMMFDVLFWSSRQRI